jgi:hypothetical protein
MIFIIGLSAIFLGIQAIRLSKRGDIDNLKKYIGTKNPTTAKVVGIIGIIVGLVLLLLATGG